jgi:outer membrane protein assembly factor BamB
MGHATPVVTTLFDTRQYLVFTGLNLLGVRASDGKILWRHPWKTQESMNAANPVRIGPDQILIGSCDNGTTLLRVDRDFQVTEVWRNKRVRLYYGTPLVYKQWAFAKDDSQQLVCLEWATGEEKWRQPKFGTIWYDSGGLLFGDKILVTNGRTGDLFVVAATGDRYTQLATLRSPAGPETLPAPIFSNGILLLRSRSQLLALQLPGTKPAMLAAVDR